MLNVLSGVGLAVAVVIFLASAVAVVFLGTYLAKYGDALASLTGWGRLFVGSIPRRFGHLPARGVEQHHGGSHR